MRLIERLKEASLDEIKEVLLEQEREITKLRQQAGVLSELNSCPTLLASGVDIEPIGDGKPRGKIILTGPEDLMTRFFNELIMGRGRRG